MAIRVNRRCSKGVGGDDASRCEIFHHLSNPPRLMNLVWR
jgi:hypothetical protein